MTSEQPNQLDQTFESGPTAPSGPLPPWLRPIAPVASWVYRKGLDRRNAAFDAGRGVVTFDRPVISVGNLSVGGTGKTPTVAWLASLLRSAGLDPCIAMRGYGSEGRPESSDEAQLYKAQFDDLPVVAQPNRVEGLLDLFATPRGTRVTTVLLDDGFQHRRIARQFDLVLIDAAKDPWQDRLLPAGWLREEPSALSRAHGVLITHAPDPNASNVAAIRDRIRTVSPHATIATADHAWNGLDIEGRERAPVEWLRGKRLFACCAIGNPNAFIAQIASEARAPLAGTMILRDHDPFSDATIRKLMSLVAEARADAIVTTAKDWSKLQRVREWPCPVARPNLTMRFTSNEEALKTQLLSVRLDDLDSQEPEPETPPADEIRAE
jgi:tetraacyldisaccharide 4'-kinase